MASRIIIKLIGKDYKPHLHVLCCTCRTSTYYAIRVVWVHVKPALPLQQQNKLLLLLLLLPWAREHVDPT